MSTSPAHLKELRQRLIVSLVSVVLFGALSYVFAEQIARFFMTPLFLASPDLIKLVYTSLPEAFITYLKLSLLSGLTLSVPILLYEIWMFTAPGLHADEKKTVLTVVFWATLLFAAGAGFAFFIVLPRVLHFFMGYLTFVARTSLALGLAFEIPFLMVVAVRVSWVGRGYFAANRKYFYLVILLLAVLLAAGDLTAAVLLCLPLFGLYECGVLISSLFAGKTPGDASPADGA
jgi:sec-independent protein translocase protein TatC